MKAVCRVGNKTKRQKQTNIGHSPLTRFRSKRKSDMPSSTAARAGRSRPALGLL